MIENTKDNQEKMFFLTKTDGIEITSIEEIFNCGNQALYDPRRPDLEFDRFGRNYTDRLFVEFCGAIWLWFDPLNLSQKFHSLSCKKEKRGKYIVSLQWNDKAKRGELEEMVNWLEERMKEVAQ